MYSLYTSIFFQRVSFLSFQLVSLHCLEICSFIKPTSYFKALMRAKMGIEFIKFCLWLFHSKIWYFTNALTDTQKDALFKQASTARSLSTWLLYSFVYMYSYNKQKKPLSGYNDHSHFKFVLYLFLHPGNESPLISGPILDHLPQIPHSFGIQMASKELFSCLENTLCQNVMYVRFKRF